MARLLGTILLAEDDENDVLLMKHLLEKCKVLNPLQVVRDGDEAICYLKGEGQYADHARYPMPILLLLDLRMARVGGLDVLKWMQTQPHPAIITIVLTGFQDLKLMNEAYQLGARSFLTKPLEEHEFCALICSYRGVEIGKRKE
jgi:CheY-like chemotaxis protein